MRRDRGGDRGRPACVVLGTSPGIVKFTPVRRTAAESRRIVELPLEKLDGLQ